MINDAENNPKQEKPQPGGSVKSPDMTTDSSPEAQSHTTPQDISKKNSSQSGDSQNKVQQMPENEKRKAS
jgi:hypothetical protein